MMTLKFALQSGYGEESSNSVYNMLMSCFIMIGGWLYMTYLIVLVSNVYMASDSSENKLEEMSREIDEFCDEKRLSHALRTKIKEFFRYKFTLQYFDDDAIKDSMPASLRKEIMMQSCSNLVHKVALFQEIPQLLIENIISCLKFEVYFPKDVIIKANTIGESMYFLAYGTAAIVTSSGKITRFFTKKIER